MKTQTMIVAGLLSAGVALTAGPAGCGSSNQARVFSTVPPSRSAEPIAMTPPSASPAAPEPLRPAMRGQPLPATRPMELTDYPDAPGMEMTAPEARMLASVEPIAMPITPAPATSSPATPNLPMPAATSAPQNPPMFNVFGEGPGAALTGTASDATLLDGMESLSQVTFATEGAAFDPCLSKDGKTIVFASTQHRNTADLYAKSVSGRTITQLTADPAQDLMPAISPDGQRVAFTSNRAGSWDIYIISINGGQAVQLTNDRTHELHPSWSPDGTKIVFCRLGEVSRRWEMWVVDVNQPVVSEFIGYGLFPSWCPVPGTGEGGRDKIAFQRSRERGDRAFSVWTVDYKPGDASSPTEIASTPSAALINPAWSPDGKRIVFAAVPNTSTANRAWSGATAMGPTKPSLADLWMVDVNGAGRVNLTAGRFVNFMPTWGPDGRIYFVSDRGGLENIWSIGTEKAILAATGIAPPSDRETAKATPQHPAPSNTPPAPEHAQVPERQEH